MTAATTTMTMPRPEVPPPGCRLCPRLADFRAEQQSNHPDWYNAPVPLFGDRAARLLVAGLAPGMKGANRTGRPFTGDYAGDLLYATLGKFGFAKGQYRARPDDGLVLRGCAIVNAVRCLPPQNKPTPLEIATCNRYFMSEINSLPKLSVILALGKIAHDAVLTSFGKVRARHKFAHGACHEVAPGLTMFNSYHCSRYNTNTGRLTTQMFESVFEQISTHLA